MQWERLSPLRPWLPAIPGVLLLALASASFGRGLVDDAYISLTYARHLAEGDGLVFHPALPRAEGYSNLLWTLMLAVGLKLGASGAALAAGLGGLLSAATIALLCRRVGGAKGVGLGLAIALSPIYGYWSTRGLEGGLVSLLLMIAVLHLGSRAAWISFGLLGLARVEGVVWGGLGVLYALAQGKRKPDLRAAALWLVPTLLQMLFRRLYYGSFSPAPLLAKGRELDLALIRKGLRWLMGALTGDPLFLIVLVVTLVLSVRLLIRRQPTDRAPWAALSALGLVLFGLAVGGDWMPNLRWLMPAVPLIWLAAAELIPSAGQLGALVGLSALLGAQTGLITLSGDSSPRHWAAAVEVFMRGAPSIPVHPAQLFVLEHLREEEAIVQPDIGLLAWMTGNPVLDPQGLTWQDAAIAQRHAPGTPEHEEAIDRVRDEIKALNPAMLGLTIRSGQPAGAAAEALIGARPTLPPVDWFRDGWTLWREEDYSPGVSIRYYLRDDITERLPARVRLKRYEVALERAPEASALRSRVVWTLKQLDRSQEAREIDEAMDPRDRRLGEIWSR